MSGFACFTFNQIVARSPISKDINCLILESDPNPNYYAKGNFPPNKHIYDWHLYLPIKNKVNCFQDIVIRNLARLHDLFNLSLHISPGQMTLNNEYHQAIRINTKDINHIPLVIEELEKMGFKLMADKRIKEYKSELYFKKYTEFIEIEEGVYQDSLVPERFFFSIPNSIEFDRFTKGMEQIKNSCNFHLFDTYLVYLFVKGRVENLIGIYSNHCDKNRFGELKEQIKEVFLDNN